MSDYPRSVLFRVAGVIAGGSFWIGLIVLALANMDTPLEFPDELRATWPFWLVMVAVTVAVFFVRRRLDPGPGWGSYSIGLIAPFLGLLLNAQIGGGGAWFWLPVVFLVLIPLPSLRRRSSAD